MDNDKQNQPLDPDQISGVHQLQPIKILLVEDNPGDIELVRAGFEDALIANQLMVISDGQQALNFIQSKQPMPDIILLDINLPKVDGFEILQEIRQQPHSCNIPVIMLTSSEAERDISQSYQYKANSFVTKPVDFSKFIDAIKKLEQFWLTVVKLPTNHTDNE